MRNWAREQRTQRGLSQAEAAAAGRVFTLYVWAGQDDERQGSSSVGSVR